MKWYDIQAKSPQKATVYIFGDIGESWWAESVTAKQFVKDLDAVTASDIDFRINSVGGSVIDGLAIYNAIKRKAGTKAVYIEGLAASIASLIAMAGDTVEIAANAMIMVHAPWGSARGNAADMREMADLLDRWAAAMAGNYASKTGKTNEQILALLQDGKDHWYSAEEALYYGFADSIGAEVAVAASANLNLSRFRDVPAVYSAIPKGTVSMTPEQLAAFEANARAQAEITARVTAEANAKAAAELAAKTIADAQAKDQGEIVRKAEIVQVFSKFKDFDWAAGLQTELLANPGKTIADAKSAILDKVSSGSSSVMSGFVHTIGDSRDKMVTGFTAALEARAGLAKDDRANNFRSYSMYDMARDCLRAAGVSDFGGNKLQIMASAFTHSTSDFPKLLENIANKSMLKGWEEAEEELSWTSKGVLTDFKTQKRVDLNLFPTLTFKPEGGEYEYATIGERGESVILATYARRFSMTREMVINDDMDAFSKIPNRMGRAAKRTVANLAWSALLDNPIMSDSIALFHASHNNLNTAAAISTDSVDVMRAGMRKQKDADSFASAGLNIRMKYLLAPVSLEGKANVVRTSQFHVGTTINNTIPNSQQNMFEVLSDARMDAASATAWYGVADPNSHDGVEIQYLNGVEEPFMDRQEAWNVDGVELKVRLDAAAKALDFRTLAKNAGV